MGKVLECDGLTLAKKLEEEVNVLVDFYSDTCGPCKMLSFVLDDIAKDIDDVALLKINFDNHKDAVIKHKVTMYPTLIVFKNGKEISRLKGLQPKPLILKAIGK